MPDLLEFEEPVGVLLKEIEALSMLPRTPDRERSIETLRQRADEIRAELYANLTPWQRVLVARHPNRPNTLDYVERLFTGCDELHGDRRFADDHAIVCGFADYKGQPVAVVGHQKGATPSRRSSATSATRGPEGYRKALRVMQLAQKFSRPILVFIDTPAAYPGVESEERGVAEAIAFNLREMMMLEVPIIVLVCGEGGSGGALGIAIGDRVLMQEFSVYSVIPPEGCAAILWRDANRKIEAAEALKITAPDLLALGLIDAIVPGADRRRPQRLTTPRRRWSTRRCRAALAEVASCLSTTRLERRYDKFRKMGEEGSAFVDRRAAPTITEPAEPEPSMKSLLWHHLPCNDDEAASAGVGARRASRRRAAAVPARPQRSRRQPTRFLNPSLDHLHDPFKLTDMDRAVDRIERRARATGADRDPRRLRRGRHHVDRHPPARARDARRRRRAFHP